MIRSIIVDDLTPSREQFSNLVLSNFDNVAVLAATDSSVRAVQAIHYHNPDLVFLNLSQPISKTFKLLEHTRDKQFQVILTSDQQF